MKKSIVAMSLVLVSAALSATGATVPIDCYLEYLGSAEAQIVNTGYVFTKKPRVEARAIVTTTSDRYIFGTSDAEASNLFSAKYWGSNKLLTYRYGSTSPVMNRATIDDFYNQWIDFVWSDVVTHDGVAQGVPAPAADFSGNTAPFWLFGCGAGKGYINFQYVKMYDGGLLVRDLHPVKSNGVAGMYDLLNDVFYPNAGTGTFKTGAVVPAVGTRGSCGSFGTPTPAYGVVPNSDSTIAFSLTGAKTFADGVTAYPSDDGLERARFQGLSVSCDGGAPTVTSGTTYTFDVPDGTKAVSAEWAFTDRQVCLSLVQAGGGSAELYVDDAKVEPGDYWMEDGKTVTVRIVPTDGGRYLGCKGSDWRAESKAQEFTVSLTGEGLAVTARVESATYVGPVRTWLGGTVAGGSYSASAAANWVDGIVPESGDTVVFDATATSDCRWDLDIKPGSWTQTVDFAGTVTFATTYGDALPFVEVLGDVVLNGGTWTHLANGGLNRTYRLYVKVGGDMTVDANAKVTAYALGYQKQYMANGDTFSGTKIYATHGGFGYENTVTWPLGGNGAVPYGKIRAPEEPGSGSNSTSYLGGGAIRLDVAGLLTIDGKIDANALEHKNYTGAGGSVYLRAGTIAGSGSVEANSMTTAASCGNGSGGRVAIILTEEGATFEDFDPQVRCSAYSGTLGSSNDFGQPGTIYAETPADTPNEGWLIIKSAATASANKYCNMTPVASYDDDTPAKYARITVINKGAAIWVPDYATVDMSAMTAGTYAGTINITGEWKPPMDGVIDYPVVSYEGFANVDAAVLNFVSGSSLKLNNLGEETFAGDLAIAEGVTVTAESPLKVAGDLVVNGVVTRTTTLEPVEVEVGGDMTIGATGSVTAYALGYNAKLCPLDQTYNVSGSHGGYGWGGKPDAGSATGGDSTCQPFGSVLEPLTYGPGGTGSNSYGGGVVRIVVNGKLTNDGAILATAKEGNYYMGAGGSVNVRAGELAGGGVMSSAGSIQGNAAEKWARSSGGRLAVRLTKSGADFSDYTGRFCAQGSAVASPAAKAFTGAAGTMWFKAADDSEDEGTLQVDNFVAGLKGYRATLLGGAFMEKDELAYRDVLIGLSAKLKLEDNQVLTVSGVFSNGCEFVAGDGSTLAFAGTTPSVIYGDVTLCNLSCQTPGKHISVAPGATVTVTGAADLTGGAGNRIVMKSLADGEKWNLVGSAIVMNGVALNDCVSATPITVLDGEDLGGNSDNITFMGAVQGELLTWTGESDGAWANAANWDVGRVPIAADDIVIPADCPNMPSLAGDVTVINLTVEEGASLALAGRNLAVNGNAAIAGALVASGEEVVSVVSNLTLASCVAAQSTIRLTGTGARTLALADGVALHVLDLGIGAVSVSSDVKADTLTVGDGAAAFAVTFGVGATVDVNSFTARGDAEQVNGSLMAADGGVWKLVASVPSVEGVAVTGSDASDGVTVVPTNCMDGGRNVNWLFVDNRTHWTGAVSSDFAEPGNWSDGVPDASKDAVIEGSVACVVPAAGAVRNLTVSPNAVLRVNAADFAVGGSLTIEPSGTVEWNESGSVAGKLTMLKDSVLTHGVNTAATHTNRIDLTIGGTGYIAAGAKVDACGKQAKATVSGAGPAHGGCNGVRSNQHDGIGYGSILHPTTVGGLGSFNAGGAIRLTFAGALKLDGEIDASAAYANSSYGSAGGSVWLTAASVEGAGTIHADGNVVTGIQGGGGGRIAIYLTEATALGLGGTSVYAWGGHTAENYVKGGAGTIYIETAADLPGQGTLTVANVEGKVDSNGYVNGLYTDYPSSVGGDAPRAISRVNMVIKYYGRVYLTGDASVGSLSILDSTSKIHLNGHHLRVHTYRPDDWNDSRVDAGDGGTIDWNIPGLMLIVK